MIHDAPSLRDADLAKAEALAKGIKIPSQPKVVLAIHAEMQKPNASFKAITNLIASDLALAAKILKVVNSPFYGLRQTVTSISQAFSLLGMRTFQRVILTAALNEVLIGSANKAYTKELELFWHATLTVAKITEFLSVRDPNFISIITPDQAYLAGLFHDCAVPLFIGKFPHYSKLITAVKQTRGNIYSFEEEHFGGHHGAIGYLMAKSWQLPMPVCQAIRFHHLPRLDASHMDEMMLLDVLPMFEIVRLGNFLSEVLLVNKGWDIPCCYASDEEFLSHINMTATELNAVKQEVMDCINIGDRF